MERKLASVQIISDLHPIPGADLIEVATVNSWKLVVKKGEFRIGDKAIYCEIDSFLPIKEEFEFLRKSSYKKMGNIEGFRLRTIKLRGQISQGLLLPLSIINKEDLQIGEDVTELLGITKYEPPIPAQLTGKVKGNFPAFIPKTDEERIQNLTEVYPNWKNETFYVTEKLDGSSFTCYYNNGVFGVCSRNLELLETEDNAYWKAARNLNLEERLRDFYSITGNICLQGELIGEGIQGNPYDMKGQTVRFFNSYNIDKQCYHKFNEFYFLVAFILDLDIVPIILDEYQLPNSIDDLLLFADGKSKLNNYTDREGLVIRSHDRNISFKVISNNFLLKEK